MAHTENDLRDLLAKNQMLSRRAAAHDRAIHESARREHDRIGERLSKMEPGQVALSPSLAYDYQRLVDERGKLTRL